MKTLTLLHIALLAIGASAANAQTPTPSPTPLTFQQATDAKRNLVNPTAAACLAADNAILATPDITTKQSGYVLSDKAVWMQRTGALPADVSATFLAAYQAGNTAAFKSYLKSAFVAGDPTQSAALALLPSYLSASTNPYEALTTQATAQELQGQPDAALQSWKAAANTFKSYVPERGVAIAQAIRVSIKLKGESPTDRNAWLVPMLTAYNVPFADPTFRADYDAVNRPSLSNADLTAFDVKMLAAVAPTSINGEFLGTLKTAMNLHAGVTSGTN